ncbi:MAG: hypothetical protein AMJ46_10475 [Latescibacteria bacterium DG_63]|nr:MAG: hypothetical protein AMJ46_10475 [Latescibacteria bacterium DG_63]
MGEDKDFRVLGLLLLPARGLPPRRTHETFLRLNEASWRGFAFSHTRGSFGGGRGIFCCPEFGSAGKAL